MADTSISIPIGANITNVPTNIGAYVSNIVGAILMVAALAAFVYLVWGGVQWIIAGGDTKKIEAARERITGAIIGLAVTAASWGIFLLVDFFFGLNVAGKTVTTSTSSSSSSNATNSHLASYPGVAACPCNNGGCASLSAPNNISQTSGPNSCKRCTTGGWVDQTGTCNAVITCGQCP